MSAAVVAVTMLMSGVATAAGTLPSVTALNQKIKGNAVAITYAFLPKAGNACELLERYV